MSRSKSKANLKTFIFTVDSNDPKYTDLINYLESIDNGARSYVIRQILNSYVGNQCLVIPPVTMDTTEITNKVTENNDKKKETEIPVVKGNKGKSFTPPKQNNVKMENRNETKKETPTEGMTKLMQNFQ